jgi:hypothetical protein
MFWNRTSSTFPQLVRRRVARSGGAVEHIRRLRSGILSNRFSDLFQAISSRS